MGWSTFRKTGEATLKYKVRLEGMVDARLAGKVYLGNTNKWADDGPKCYAE